MTTISQVWDPVARRYRDPEPWGLIRYRPKGRRPRRRDRSGRRRHPGRIGPCIRTGED